MIDFSNIEAPQPEIALVDPIELFQALKVTDRGINDLWLAQGDALREWHNNRNDPDVGIVLNTGAGKTLVGLLVAQSLVNETKGRVLYACSSIQLVEQTREKAAGYGLKVTTYFRGNYSNDLYSRCDAPCVTTYQALFNGFSVFSREEIAAVVFDDAHTAEHLLRDHFSVQINKTNDDNLYAEIIHLFEDYFRNIGRTVSLQETKEGKSGRVLFVPPFEVRAQHSEMTRRLLDRRVQENNNTKFAWAHIKDNVDQCCVLISASHVTVTPAFVPVLTLSYFAKSVRRIYLSATLTAPDSFARTFGKPPNRIVAPITTAGECERLIAIPSTIDTSSDGTSLTQQIIEARKALILVPTYSRANEWKELVAPPPRDYVTEHVAAFRESSDNRKLLLAARFDGVDLPGDTCRLMVIDDIPMGVGPLERYLWESLGMNSSLRSAIASRIVQSFGRISRGMTDHGVVILTGKRLTEWLFVPKNLAILPAFLQKQLLLGEQLSKRLFSAADLHDAVDACLNRNEDWLDSYERFMQRATVENTVYDTEGLQQLAKAEAAYGALLWRRDYKTAAKAISATLQTAYALSNGTGAWHSLWLGFAHEMMGDTKSARELYSTAHSNQHNIPPVRREYNVSEKLDVRSQVLRIESQMRMMPDKTVSVPKMIGPDLQYLSGGGSPAQTEEALRCLGTYLGLNSTRPDKEYGTGPDVLWIGDSGPALCIEAKSKKESNSVYGKQDIGQMSDHVQWVTDHNEVDTVLPLFVGPVSKASASANPSTDVVVTELASFYELSRQLVSALEDTASSALPITLRSQLSDVLDERNLSYPNFLDSLSLKRIRDL